MCFSMVQTCSASPQAKSLLVNIDASDTGGGTELSGNSDVGGGCVVATCTDVLTAISAFVKGIGGGVGNRPDLGGCDAIPQLKGAFDTVPDN